MPAAGTVGRWVDYRLPFGQPVDAHIEKAAYEQAEKGKNRYQESQSPKLVFFVEVIPEKNSSDGYEQGEEGRPGC